MRVADDLNSEQTLEMLNKLATDDDYRKLFVNDLGAALAQLQGSPAVPKGVAPGTCLMPEKLASKQTIQSTIKKLHNDLMGSDNYIPKILEAS